MRTRFRWLGAPALLVVLTVAGLLAFVLMPGAPAFFGLNRSDAWFVDSYAILAACDAANAGLDPHQPSPLDLFHRPHVYSDWWLGLRWLGLTRADNFLVGATWCVAFLLVAWLTLQPRNLWQAIAGAGALLAPPCLIALNRANNDLVVFVVLGLGALLVRGEARRAWVGVLPLLALAVGLKYYPVAAVALFLPLRPARVRLPAVVSGALVAAGALLAVWGDVPRGQIPIPPLLHTFGSQVLLRDVGATGAAAAMAGPVMLTLGALSLARSGRTVGLLAPEGHAGRQALFALGGALLLACFLAGFNFNYRWIFALWLLPWLLDAAGGASASRPARLALVLLGVNLWVDGVFCGVLSLWGGTGSLEQVRAWERAWRLATQPFAWALMVLIGGWLADAGLAMLRRPNTARATALPPGLPATVSKQS